MYRTSADVLIFNGKLYFPKNPIPIGKVSVHDYVRQIMRINPVIDFFRF